MNFKLPVSPAILAEISKFDHFQGQWSAQPVIPPDRLPRLEAAARLQSVGASCRLAGIRVSDIEVSALVRGGAAPLHDSDEMLGYWRAADVDLPAGDRMLEWGMRWILMIRVVIISN